jgi:uncharacterized protein (DUF1501 family)
MGQSRREFLYRSGCGLTFAALASAIERFSLVNALAQPTTDYKALVCIYLNGGNDGNNMVVPYDDYNVTGGYGAVRGGSGLAVPQSSLLQISPLSQAGVKYGFHPSMTEIQTLFNQQKVAVLCNAGPLVQPLTRTLYQSGVGHPYQLFSHPDQTTQQQTSVSTTATQVGWGGRLADSLSGINGSALLPMATSTARTNLFMTGANTRQLVIPPSGSLANAFFFDTQGFPSSSLEPRLQAFDQLREEAANLPLTKTAADTLAQALQAREALSTEAVLPPLQAGQTDFPNTWVGNQLKQVAKFISLHSSLGLNRQIFFCQDEGFDHHINQRGSANLTQDKLLLQLSASMKAFYDATVNLGVSAQVTAFTLTDFGRTLEPSGSGAAVGSDHAWGNHQLIMGGAVRGGDFYGTFPTLALGGPDDAESRGRWIPTTAVEQYAATLARWYGLPEANIPDVFPFLSRFASNNLGFLL